MTIKALCSVFALALALLPVASVVAHAEERMPYPTPAPAGSPPAEGYRLQILAADATAVAVFAAGAAAEGEDGRDTGLSEVLMTGGLGTFFLGAPTVHAAHGNWGRAGISLVLRTALPLVGAIIGGRSATCGDNELLCGMEEVMMGFAIGGAVASAADLLVVTPGGVGAGSRSESVRTSPATGTSTAGLSLAPRLMASRHGALVGIGAQF